jgi:hypothetical protein
MKLEPIVTIDQFKSQELIFITNHNHKKQDLFKIGCIDGDTVFLERAYDGQYASIIANHWVKNINALITKYACFRIIHEE